MGKWIWIVAALFLGISGCGSDDTPTRPNTFTPLTSIVIEADLNTLAHGTSTQLIAKGNYSGLFTRDITSQVVWSSDKPNVADFLFVSTPGRIKAVSSGVATIIVTTPEGVSASFLLTVTDATITALSISPQSPSRPLGLSQAFTVEGTFSDLTRQPMTFDATWTSSDSTVATISDDVASKGEAVTLKIGTTTISAAFTGVSDSTTLKVTDSIPVSIAVTSDNTSLLSLSTQTFKATGTFSDSSILDVSTRVLWGSSNPNVASVAADGKVTTLTSGTTTISATLEDVTGGASLKVTGGSLQIITLTLAQTDNKVLFKETVSRITARGSFSNNTSRDITGAIETWAVTDETKAKVSFDADNLAWVQALAVTPTAIPTKISAKYGSVPDGDLSLNVTDPILSSLTIAEKTLNLTIGTSAKLSLTGAFTPISNQDLTPSATWSSSVQAIATVGDLGLEKGRVRAIAAGTSEITASYGGREATTTVTVKARTLERLTIAAVTNPTPIIAGTEKKFKVTAHYTDGYDQDVTDDVEWTIDNSNVVKFSDKDSDPGLVIAVDSGTTTLKATLGEKSDTETITVQAAL